MPAPKTAVTERMPFFTPGVWAITALAAAGLGTFAYRLLFGLGATTNLDQQHPWGLWIAIDVASGVALAAGGFTTAFLAHVLHREEYEPVVRPALLTAMLGYTFVALGVFTDLGRYWAMWHVMMPGLWQGNSVLLEVGLCVAAYLTVLYIEFVPIFCARFADGVRLPAALRALELPLTRLARFAGATVGRVMTVFILLGIVLSCMHQSSLGTLMVIAPTKMHPLWFSPVLPLLFLLSAFMVGYPMVIFESLIASWAFKRPPERRVLERIGHYVPVPLAIYFAARVIDLIDRGVLPYAIDGSLASVLLLLELGLGVVVPFLIFLSDTLRRSMPWLFTAASLVVAGVVLNRVDVFVVAYRPPYAEHPYVPAATEVVLTLGFISLLVLLYRFFVLNFPVIEGMRGRRHA